MGIVSPRESIVSVGAEDVFSRAQVLGQLPRILCSVQCILERISDMVANDDVEMH